MTQKATISLYVEPELKLLLEDLARREERSLTQFLARAIKERFQPGKKPEQK